jgi:two-component system chemotaxis response regulator CheB
MSVPSVRDIVVIGGSAGAVEAASTIVRGLPPGLPAALAIVIHVHEQSPNVLAKMFERLGTLPAVTVSAEMPLERGRIHVAAADQHLRIEGERIRPWPGPKENQARPAIDTLFRSAAAFGARVVGVILSGNLDDGSAGLHAIKRAGGLTVVQDPADAAFPCMPSSALAVVDVDHRLPATKIAPLLVAAGEGKMPTAERQPEERAPNLPRLTSFTCPECHGALTAREDGLLTTFACHTGHNFGIESLHAGQDEELEIALWSAVRVLQEKMMLLDRLAARPGNVLGDHHHKERQRLEQHVTTLRRLLRVSG